MNAPDEFGDVERVLARSRLITLIRIATERAERSFQSSRIVSRVREGVAACVDVPLASRVRLAGVFLTTFIAAYLVLLQFLPLRTIPAMPLAVWVFAGAIGILLVAAGSQKRVP